MYICSKHRSKSPARLMVLFVVSILAISASKAVAQDQSSNKPVIDTTAATETAIVSDFYTIEDGQTALLPIVQKDPPAATQPPADQGPAEVQEPENPTPQNPTNMSPLESIAVKNIATYVRAVAVSLLRWTYHNNSDNRPAMKYDRKFHFGRWINDPNDETCYNTRARVLIRDSETAVSFKDKNHCVVETGRWADPYAGGTLLTSKELQIDHMVPLKNAYISGAWEWNFQTRCTYANYMGNTFHLVTASGHENMSKGDDTPEKYMPPNQSYRCEYLANWLKIKLIWNLRMGRSEVEAIRQEMKDSGCDGRKFKMSSLELKRQRKLIYENRYSCPDR